MRSHDTRITVYGNCNNMPVIYIPVIYIYMSFYVPQKGKQPYIPKCFFYDNNFVTYFVGIEILFQQEKKQNASSIALF